MEDLKVWFYAKEQQYPRQFSYFYMATAMLAMHVSLFINKCMSDIQINQQPLLRSVFVLILNYFLMSNEKDFHCQMDNKYLIYRSILGTLGFFTMQLGVQYLLMTELYSIYNLNPIVAVVIAYFVLDDKFSTLDMLGLISSFIGSILVIKPPQIFEINQQQQKQQSPYRYLGILGTVANGVMYGIVVIVVKKMPPSIKPQLVLQHFQSMLLAASVISTIYIDNFVALQFRHCVLQLAAAAGVLVWQNLQVRAIQLYLPSKLMIIQYLTIFYGFICDVDDLTIVGAGLIFTIAVFNYFKNFNSNR